MPTTSATKTKPRRKPARKAPARKPVSAANGAKASGARASRTRASHETAAAARQTSSASRDTVEVFGEYAERAVLIPIGAALIAREHVVSTVSDTLSNYSSSSKAQAQLRRFERRGATARNRLEREVRKARVRVERELRQRRRDIESTVESTVSDLEARRDAVTKNGGELANRVQERILSLV